MGRLWWHCGQNKIKTSQTCTCEKISIIEEVGQRTTLKMLWQQLKMV
ncbi:unnamed protein product [Acanthoscelides obtectus]|uniref:Uncharacterized protein n=1 Tax=Acanthoscelides obtectus TaxID=200917 RepID=A0A9P0JQA7_ACAOB|nr:unnamed protein product [Acanthoscelides obtectus]CAK1679442.1 hypothetical protein AOBTE_LOCUS32246 [Acanthoscelides obtectus]